MRQVGLLTVAQVGDQRAGCGDGCVMAIEAEAFQPSSLELLDQRTPRAVAVELPRLDARQGEAGAAGFRQRAQVGALGHDELTRAQHAQLVFERLPPAGTGVLGRAELARGEVDQCHANLIAAVGGDAHQERRLAGLEVVGVHQGAGRHHTDDLALDDALGLFRIFHLLADGDAVALAYQTGQIAVESVIGNPAHRDRAARAVFRTRCQGQLERARRDQRVLEEHLVEIAHPEEQDGVAVLALGVVVLLHRRRQRRRTRGVSSVVWRNGHQRCAEQACGMTAVYPYIDPGCFCWLLKPQTAMAARRWRGMAS